MHIRKMMKFSSGVFSAAFANAVTARFPDQSALLFPFRRPYVGRVLPVPFIAQSGFDPLLNLLRACTSVARVFTPSNAGCEVGAGRRVVHEVLERR